MPEKLFVLGTSAVVKPCTKGIQVEVEQSEQSELRNTAAFDTLVTQFGVERCIRHFGHTAVLDAIGFEVCARHWSAKLRGKELKS